MADRDIQEAEDDYRKNNPQASIMSFREWCDAIPFDDHFEGECRSRRARAHEAAVAYRDAHAPDNLPQPSWTPKKVDDLVDSTDGLHSTITSTEVDILCYPFL